MHTPDIAAATQMLYRAADHADLTGGAILFRAIQHLTQQPIDIIRRTWAHTLPVR